MVPLVSMVSMAQERRVKVQDLPKVRRLLGIFQPKSVPPEVNILNVNIH